MVATFTLLFFVIAIVFSAFLAASETSLFSLPSFRIRSYKNEKKGSQHAIIELLKKPQTLLVSILMLNVLANILIQNVFSSFFKNRESFLFNVGIPLIIVLVFGEILPKSFAFYHNQKVAQYVAPTLLFLIKILAPFRKLLTFLTEIFSYPFFYVLKKEAPLSMKELQDLLELSKEKKILEKEEQELLLGYVNLQNLCAKEIMIPKEEIVFFEIAESLDYIKKLFQTTRFSKVLVCDKSIDNIRGILSLKSFQKHKESLQTKEELLLMCSPPFFVPETMKAYLLLKQMFVKKESLALLVDEYGSLQGLITQQDIISQVVGEKDSNQKIAANYTVIGKDAILASGRLDLITFEKIFKIPLVSTTGATTIAGWIIEKMEDIPAPGAKWLTKEFLFHIIDATPSRIKKIYIRRL